MQRRRGAPDELVECVPNFSEGQDARVMDAIAAVAAGVDGVAVLDRHADAVHHRMVLTFAGHVGAVVEAAFRAVGVAAREIDLERHRGVHPRIGAADVVPLVPIGSTPMGLCVDAARRLARRVAAELDLPVYLYAEAALRPERRRLPDVRRGEYEGLKARIESDPAAEPDFGPRRIGPAGAVVVGARPFLIAYNITIRAPRPEVAKDIARAVRESSGGMPGLQARGFPTHDPSVQQVSMNVLDWRRAPLLSVFHRVQEEAERRGAEVLASELVGLAPAGAVAEAAGSALRLPGLSAESLVETRLVDALAR